MISDNNKDLQVSNLLKKSGLAFSSQVNIKHNNESSH